MGLLYLPQPPPQTKHQVISNGVAGGASSGGGGASEDVGGRGTGDANTAAADNQHQPASRTPRKSKSMGRIHGGGGAGPEVGGAAGGPEATGCGTQQQGGGTTNTEGQKHDQAPPSQPPNPDAAAAAAPSQHWHRGHRRTPSDGVAWRHSKGTWAHTHTHTLAPGFPYAYNILEKEGYGNNSLIRSIKRISWSGCTIQCICQ